MHDSHHSPPASLGPLAGQPLAYVTTTGRRTGAPHRIEIWFAAENDVVFLLSGGRDRSDWVRNLIANPNASVEIGPQTFHGVAQVLAPDAPEDARARELLREKYRVGSELNEWARTSLPIAIRITSQEDRS